MQALLASIKKGNVLSKTLSMGLFVAVITILVVLNVDKSNNHLILAVGDFLGSTGNKLFLVSSNLVIIGWAWRNRLRSVIRLILGVDLGVLLLVQGIKLLNLGSWSIRPHGGTDGFPSGHAAHSFAMAFVLTMFFPRFAWLWYLCASAISWSRLETSSHTGFQIMAGIILGTGIAWLFVTRWLNKHSDGAINTSCSGELQSSNPIVQGSPRGVGDVRG